MPDVCIIPMQQKLYDLYDSGQLRRPVGAYGALTSQANKTTNPVEVALVGKAKQGHKAKYQITYVDAECDPVIECGESGSGICDTGTSESVQTDVKTIGNCITLKNIQITTDQFRDLCNYGPDAWLTAQLVGRLDTGMRAINEAIATTLCANAGCYETGKIAPKDIALINPTTNTPIFGATRQITQDFRKAGIMGDPILIGGDTLDMYSYGQEYGGQTQGGANFREPKFPIFYDNQLSNVCPIVGRETLLALAPGVGQFVNYLYNVGDFQTNLGGNIDLLSLYQQNVAYTKGVLEDPVTGYLWDMSVVYDTCNDVWKVNLKTNFDVWTMRLTQCYAPCFTGIVKYGVCNFAPPTCESIAVILPGPSQG